MFCWLYDPSQATLGGSKLKQSFCWFNPYVWSWYIPIFGRLNFSFQVWIPKVPRSWLQMETMFGIPDLKPFLKPLDSGYIQTLQQHIWVEFVS